MTRPIQPSLHDLQNAMIFLETFPLILQQMLQSGKSVESQDLKELLQLYVEKVEILKAGMNR